VTACNRQPSASHHAERQRGHKPENRDCNTGVSRRAQDGHLKIM
jgi:hypothetical protein